MKRSKTALAAVLIAVLKRCYKSGSSLTIHNNTVQNSTALCSVLKTEQNRARCKGNV